MEEATNLKPNQVLAKCFEGFLKKRQKSGKGRSGGKPIVDFATALQLHADAPKLVEQSRSSTQKRDVPAQRARHKSQRPETQQ